MHFTALLLSALVTVSCCQDIDRDVLDSIFGTPPTVSNTPTTQRLEDFTIRTTDATSTFVDKSGESCKCVPYYLCDSDFNGVDANNASVTGWGTLDIRFKEDECQESVEKCCTNPKSESEVPPTPTTEVVRNLGCGHGNPKGLDFTLTGGSGAEALFGEFPWVVALLDARNGSYVGVGVLIHPQVVMTAAHISYKYSPGGLKARAGEWDTQTSKERLPYQERMIKEIVKHPSFHSKRLWQDFSLLLLDEPYVLADHINVLCLPEQNENFENYRDCVANGWGKDFFGAEGRYAVILKKVVQNMMPHSLCEKLLRRTRLGDHFRLHDSFLCAGGEQGKDLCQGDGGAPLACPIGNNRYKLVGLVAWGIGCGEKDVPAVFSAVPNARQFVDEWMGKWKLDTSTYRL